MSINFFKKKAETNAFVSQIQEPSHRETKEIIYKKSISEVISSQRSAALMEEEFQIKEERRKQNERDLLAGKKKKKYQTEELTKYELIKEIYEKVLNEKKNKALADFLKKVSSDDLWEENLQKLRIFSGEPNAPTNNLLDQLLQTMRTTPSLLEQAFLSFLTAFPLKSVEAIEKRQHTLRKIQQHNQLQKWGKVWSLRLEENCKKLLPFYSRAKFMPYQATYQYLIQRVFALPKLAMQMSIQSINWRDAFISKMPIIFTVGYSLFSCIKLYNIIPQGINPFTLFGHMMIYHRNIDDYIEQYGLNHFAAQQLRGYTTWLFKFLGIFIVISISIMIKYRQIKDLIRSRNGIMDQIRYHIEGVKQFLLLAEEMNATIKEDPALEELFGHMLVHTRQLLDIKKDNKDSKAQLFHHVKNNSFSSPYSSLYMFPGVTLHLLKLLHDHIEIFNESIFELTQITTYFHLADLQKQNENEDKGFHFVTVEKSKLARVDLKGVWSLAVGKQKSVPNDFYLKHPQSIHCLMGPNAAGKSVAAQSFFRAIWCVHSLGFAPCQRGGSITLFEQFIVIKEITENTKQGFSLFRAELNQIKKSLVDLKASKEKLSFVYIDEWLKSTNYEESTALQVAILQWLMHTYPHQVYLIVTHNRYLIQHLKKEQCCKIYHGTIDKKADGSWEPQFHFREGISDIVIGIDTFANDIDNPSITKIARAHHQKLKK